MRAAEGRRLRLGPQRWLTSRVFHLVRRYWLHMSSIPHVIDTTSKRIVNSALLSWGIYFTNCPDRAAVSRASRPAPAASRLAGRAPGADGRGAGPGRIRPSALTNRVAHFLLPEFTRICGDQLQGTCGEKIPGNG